jgi:hypothetical protein
MPGKLRKARAAAKTKRKSSGSTLQIVAAVEVRDSATRGILENSGSRLTTVATVATDQLANNLEAFAAKFSKILEAITAGPNGGFSLDEITISVEVGVEGEVKLLGSGASASGSAGIDMVFRRISHA